MDAAYVSTPRARMRGRALPARLLSDERLGQLAADGDGSAFAAIYHRYQDQLYRYCRSILLNDEDASDALQSTMTSAFRALQGERRQIKLRPWLYRIAHNEAISIVRRRRPGADLTQAEGMAAPDAAADAAARERFRELVADIDDLGPRHRAALVMRELSDLSYDEIAAVFGGSQAAAKQTVYEARKTMHEMREGRAMACETIRERISHEDGRKRLTAQVRAHVKSCPPCHDFHAAIGTRRNDLAALAPPLAPALAASILKSTLEGAGATTTAGGGGAAVAAGAGGKLLVSSGAIKAAVAVVASATVGVSAGSAIKQQGADRAHEARPAATSSAGGTSADSSREPRGRASGARGDSRSNARERGKQQAAKAGERPALTRSGRPESAGAGRPLPGGEARAGRPQPPRPQPRTDRGPSTPAAGTPVRPPTTAPVAPPRAIAPVEAPSAPVDAPATAPVAPRSAPVEPRSTALEPRS